MNVRNRTWTALAIWFLALPVSAHDWTTVTAGGSTIEVPAYFLGGRLNAQDGASFEPDGTISLHQYRVETRERPYIYLTRAIANRAAETNYFVDEVGRGVVSGQARPNKAFYASCRREASGLLCIELFYDVAGQYDYGPIVDRIARSFRKGGY